MSAIGGMDIRVPLGLMFLVLGVLLAIFGWISDPAIYQRSLGINVNLIWGLVLAATGACALLLSRRAARGP